MSSLPRLESWCRQFAIAHLRLSMTRVQVLDCTPRYLDTLFKQHQREQLAAEYRQRVTDHQFAQLIAMVANTGFRGWDEARQPTEFLPVYPPDPGAPPPRRPRRPSDQQLAANLRRTMEQAMRYQEAQRKHGFTP